MLEASSGFALHHVGYAVKAIAAVSETYVSLFGYEVRTPVIHDPVQTAFVQFLSLPGERVYLEFVSPDGPASVLANAIRKGGGLNHLCYCADNIERAAEWLVQGGMLPLSPPLPAVAFAGRRVCWLMGENRVPIELVERNNPGDSCIPGL